NFRDFYNLIDVYLDAVFYPRITANAFQQVSASQAEATGACAFHRAGDDAERTNGAASQGPDPDLRGSRAPGGGHGAADARAGGGASSYVDRGANPPRKSGESPRGGITSLHFQYWYLASVGERVE